MLKDNSGNEIASFETSKSYGAVTISNNKIQKGETYTLYVNGTSKASLTANSIVTSNSSMNGEMNSMGGGGMQAPGRNARTRRKKINKI